MGELVRPDPSITYQIHLQSSDWMPLSNEFQVAGSVGQAKRLEAIRIHLDNSNEALGGIKYSTHIQGIGWQNYVKNGNLSGTSGQSKRLEAIKIKLRGELAKTHDIYAQGVGWLDWAKNGQEAGTAGYAYRLKGVQIVLIEKGTAAPGATATSFLKKI